MKENYIIRNKSSYSYVEVAYDNDEVVGRFEKEFDINVVSESLQERLSELNIGEKVFISK